MRVEEEDEEGPQRTRLPRKYLPQTTLLPPSFPIGTITQSSSSPCIPHPSLPTCHSAKPFPPPSPYPRPKPAAIPQTGSPDHVTTHTIAHRVLTSHLHPGNIRTKNSTLSGPHSIPSPFSMPQQCIKVPTIHSFLGTNLNLRNLILISTCTS